MNPDETPTPKLTERHLVFSDEALTVAELLGGVEMKLQRDVRFYDFDEARFARALRTVLELHAKRFGMWTTAGAVSSERKAKQLAELQALTTAAREFIAEHTPR